MSDQTPNRLGAPTKYHDGIPDQLLDYFDSIKTVSIMGKEFPRFNSIEGFCAHIKIAKSTFYEWLKIHDLLSNAFEIAKNNQADQLYQLTANRIFSESYGKLLTVNCTDMKDKIDTTVDTTIKINEVNLDSDDSNL